MDDWYDEWYRSYQRSNTRSAPANSSVCLLPPDRQWDRELQHAPLAAQGICLAPAPALVVAPNDRSAAGGHAASQAAVQESVPPQQEHEHKPSVQLLEAGSTQPASEGAAQSAAADEQQETALVLLEAADQDESTPAAAEQDAAGPDSSGTAATAAGGAAEPAADPSPAPQDQGLQSLDSSSVSAVLDPGADTQELQDAEAEEPSTLQDWLHAEQGPSTVGMPHVSAACPLANLTGKLVNLVGRVTGRAPAAVCEQQQQGLRQAPAHAAAAQECSATQQDTAAGAAVDQELQEQQAVPQQLDQPEPQQQHQQQEAAAAATAISLLDTGLGPAGAHSFLTPQLMREAYQLKGRRYSCGTAA